MIHARLEFDDLSDLVREGTVVDLALEDIGQAVIVCRQLRGILSVGNAAKIFNTTPEVIRRAVLSLSRGIISGPSDEPAGNQFIEIDGA